MWQVQRILDNLNTTYIDLMLIHWPGDPTVAPANTTMACAEGTCYHIALLSMCSCSMSIPKRGNVKRLSYPHEGNLVLHVHEYELIPKL